MTSGGSALAQDPDPDLDQSIAPGQPVATGRAVLRTGHVDIGPRYVDGQWRLLIHDDAAAPVWRSPDETVLQVTDAALQEVPDDPAYAFLDLEAGRRVHVVPQTQNQDVVWVGWNTQDPQVLATIDRGATLSLLGVRGPGTVTMFLQSGNLSPPEVLWRSTESAEQPVWVDVNTHTHANWVFSEPGVYLVTVRVSADLITGEKVSDSRLLRFAVGDATDTEAAFAARPDELATPAGGTPPADTPAATGEDTDGGSRTMLVAGAAVVAVLLAIALIGVLLHGRSVKRRAESDAARGDGV
ncbi:choice-of-anchor M domain-containing protein [Solwaraspora sp. WMMD1047]|uniref:choice-of-anchor M domain-containing protein n=1 Tax=Solwaraspora sp. WMMD1047 TaxID=3016102 RepID=UPI002416958D|nr:choice-of-anchor M domain-containing protein [Solwaraspora sp. WMMD1047]MDG4832963.1 choice-of-anchor M domain-containing protein [Solwaraspora sp. WMMD1047]